MRGNKCEVCGFVGDHRLFEFHHITPALKKFALSRRPKGASWPDVLLELSKCVMVCSICHRRLHLGHIQIGQEALDRLNDERRRLDDWL
jgi:hypothetical protein